VGKRKTKKIKQKKQKQIKKESMWHGESYRTLPMPFRVLVNIMDQCLRWNLIGSLQV